ncbi:hypothetical protein [Moheibacter sediminis]|nr:hypothetical protein [Moheibacter sediminis]
MNFVQNYYVPISGKSVPISGKFRVVALFYKMCSKKINLIE